MNLRLKILIGFLVTLVFVNGFYIIKDIREEIRNNQESLTQEIRVNDQIILDLHKQIETMKKEFAQELKDAPRKEKLKKIKLEQTLKQVTVMVINKTAGSQGSGVAIKYKNKYYILSAGHMAPNLTDELYLYENGEPICKLVIVKSDYSGEDVSINSDWRDLLLLKAENPFFVPKVYTEIADYEPITGTEIYVVGSPMGIEDVITDGRIISYADNFMYHMAFTYFGNSGGGVYDYNGKLIGIVSHMNNLKPMMFYPDFMIYGAVRVNFILQFMREVG